MKMRLAMWLEWTLLALGVICVGIYAVQTLEARRYQAEQAAAFARTKATPPAATDDPAASPRPAGSPARADGVETGAVLGMLEVPRLNLSTPVVEGDEEEILDRAVGHLPDTPLPWQDGNSAVAAHRDGLFRPLKDIAVGDEIRLRLPDGELRYRVARTRIVTPADLSVLEPGPRPMLTLITCYPFYYVGHAPKRFIVHAERQ